MQLPVLCSLLSLGCSARDETFLQLSPPSVSVPALTERLYVTSTVVLSEDGDNTYVSLLSSLQAQSLDLQRAREFSGWSGIWGQAGKLFLSDGEAPTMTRFAVGESGSFSEEGKVNFLNYGAPFAESAFVGRDKAYLFTENEGIVWSSSSLEITGTFPLPPREDRPGGLEYGGLRPGRSLAVRGDRAYVATNWANWEEYAVSEDSLIVVIDTVTDRVIDTLPAPCPYLDIASLDDDGNLYFSNWVYSLGPTLLEGKKKACAVRIRAGEERLDPSWSLTFADATGGREAAALRYVGNGKAVISVYEDERATIDDRTDPSLLANAANWRFWLLDLNTRRAEPITEIEHHAGGFTASRVDGRTFLLVPSADYDATSVYELSPDGSVQLLWAVPGWSTELFALR